MRNGDPKACQRYLRSFHTFANASGLSFQDAEKMHPTLGSFSTAFLLFESSYLDRLPFGSAPIAPRALEASQRFPPPPLTGAWEKRWSLSARGAMISWVNKTKGYVEINYTSIDQKQFFKHRVRLQG